MKNYNVTCYTGDGDQGRISYVGFEEFDSGNPKTNTNFRVITNYNRSLLGAFSKGTQSYTTYTFSSGNSMICFDYLAEEYTLTQIRLLWHKLIKDGWVPLSDTGQCKVAESTLDDIRNWLIK
jgi:hypothetical protein